MNNEVSIYKIDDEVIINTRVKFISKDIFYYTLPTIILIPMHFLIFVYVFLLTLITYSLFRLFTWMYYSEIIINQKKGTLYVSKFKFSNLLDKKLVSSDFIYENLKFKKIERRGKIKYIISYETHKEIELLIITEKEYFKLKTLF